LVYTRGLHPPPGQFMEKLLVELLIRILASHGEEDVATDKLVDHLTVSRETLEDDVLIILELNHHMSCLPINIPGLHS